MVVQITDVSQTKWIEEGWFRFDSKRMRIVWIIVERERERVSFIFLL